MRYLLVVLLFTQMGCRIVTWGTVYAALSPDAEAELQVQEKACFEHCELQIVVKRSWSTEQLAWRSDCVIDFAHAAWEGPIVSVFVDGASCGQMKVAFDTNSHRSVDFKSTEKWLGNSISQAYGVTPQELESNHGNVFIWATYPCDGHPWRSTDEFRKRHPGL